MSQIIARCGIICSECPAYVATQKDDNQLRAKVAADWSKEFGGTFKPEDINCDGCLTTGERVFNYCRECKIRLCGSERSLANCGHCPEYACEKLEKFFAQAPSARGVLDGIAGRKG